MMISTSLQSPTLNARVTLLAVSLAVLTACGGSASETTATASETTTAQAQSASLNTEAPTNQARTENWVVLVGEGQTFNVPTNTMVRYGRDDVGWVNKTVSGEGVCSNEFFDFDPKPMGYRHCYVQAAVTPVPTPQPTTTPPPPAGDNAAAPQATCGLAGFASDALAAINAFRASAQSCGSEGNFPAVEPLRWNAQLNEAARVHSAKMVETGTFSHQIPGEEPFNTRATNVGYTGFANAENIAAGYASVSSVMQGWEKSPGHCANLMNKSSTEVGLACVSNSQGTRYWTMELGIGK